MKQPINLIKEIWTLAHEIAYFGESDASHFNHFSSKKDEAEPHVFKECFEELEISKKIQSKIKEKNYGVLDSGEFEELVSVFRLLKKWRDEAIESSQKSNGTIKGQKVSDTKPLKGFRT